MVLEPPGAEVRSIARNPAESSASGPRSPFRPLGLPWLPLAILFVMAATLFPPLLRHCEAPGWSSRIGAADVLGNLVLFVPIGLVLRRQRWQWVVVISLVLSSCIEAGQGSIARSQNLVDIVANVTGACVAWATLQLPAASQLFDQATPRRLRVGLVAGALLIGSGLFWLGQRLPPANFSAWETVPFVVGNEPSGQRPWLGTIESIEMYDSWVDVAERSGRTGERGDDDLDAIRPILSVDLRPPGSIGLNGPRGRLELPIDTHVETLSEFTEEGFRISSGGLHLPDEASHHVHAALRETSAFTLVVDLVSAATYATGPARIVSLAPNPFRSNLMLGQEGGDVVLRVRTGRNGPSGRRPELRSTNAALAPGRHRVEARYDGVRSTLVVDGRCVDERLMTTESTPLPLGLGMGATVVCMTALFGLAIASLGTWSRPLAWAAAFAGSTAAAMLITLTLPLPPGRHFLWFLTVLATASFAALVPIIIGARKSA